MKPTIDQKTEEILNSLDGIKKAGAPDFFYTRLMARMSREHEAQKNTHTVRKPLLLRPVFAVLALLIVILVNMAVILQGNNDTESATETDAYQSIAAEYRLNDSVIEEVYK